MVPLAKAGMLRAMSLRRVPFLVLLLSLLSHCQREVDDLDNAQLEAVIAEQRPSIQVCYQDALDREPYENEVRMQATLHVRNSGEVAQVQLGEGGLPGMRPCLEQAIMKWRFPEAGDDTHASLPIIFQPEKP